MNMNDLILVSVDDHLVEPPDMFLRHMPSKYQNRAPRIVKHKGKDVWRIEDRIFTFPGLSSVAGRPREEYGIEPTTFDQMRRGCYEPKARVDDMNANGVLAALCFPCWSDFAGRRYIQIEDKDFAFAMVRAANDWHIYDWCGAVPGRFIPLGVLPLWDVDLAVTELKRLIALGVHAITFPDNPTSGGMPSIHSGYWDKLFALCEEHRVVICAHIGTGNPTPIPSEDAPQSCWITNFPLAIANGASDWVFSQVFVKFPKLKLSLSEGGIGWVPYFMERADFTYEHQGPWTRAYMGGRLPSQIMRENVLCCFIDDKIGIELRHHVGVENISWECDYPHADTTWPQSPEILWESIRHIPKAEIDRMTHLNAMRDYCFDPFAILGRENCTVGALRAQATHVDVGVTYGLGGIPPNRTGAPVTCGDVIRQQREAAAAE